MRKTRMFWTALILLAAASAYAGDMPAGVKTGKTSSGMAVLTDAKGMTLYTYDKDANGKSNCNGNCAKNWPPVMPPGDAMSMGDWTVVIREDGMKQWAYKGKPLYTFSKDTKPGDTTGDGVGQAWHMAMP